MTRLNLILEKKIKWDYNKSPLLSNYLNEHKLNKPNEILVIPKPLERGGITAKELTQATTADECVVLIQNWANKVYQAWNLNHLLVAEIAAEFLKETK